MFPDFQNVHELENVLKFQKMITDLKEFHEFFLKKGKGKKEKRKEKNQETRKKKQKEEEKTGSCKVNLPKPGMGRPI